MCWDSGEFHCPAWGATVFTETGEPTDHPCEHLLFSWISELGEYYNTSPEIQELIEDDNDLQSPDDEEFLDRCPESAVLFALTPEGMANGPIHLTVIHAIRFPTSDSDQ